jgi:hypothetical protein
MATAASIQTRVESNPTYQAYQVLHVGFSVLPIIAGLDKFFHILLTGTCTWLHSSFGCRRYQTTV